VLPALFEPSTKMKPGKGERARAPSASNSSAVDAPRRCYGAVRHYLKAIAKAGTDNADQVAAAMKASAIEDVFSENARIREDGRVMRTMYLLRVKKPSDSKYPWGYFEIVRTIPPEETVWPLSESKCALVNGANRDCFRTRLYVQCGTGWGEAA
jgi:hypothetical protein